VGQPERWCKTSSPSFRLPAVFSVHGMSILMSSKHGRFVGLSPKDTAAHSPAVPGVSFAIHSGEVPRCATMCHQCFPRFFVQLISTATEETEEETASDITSSDGRVQ